MKNPGIFFGMTINHVDTRTERAAIGSFFVDVATGTTIIANAQGAQRLFGKAVLRQALAEGEAL